MAVGWQPDLVSVSELARRYTARLNARSTERFTHGLSVIQNKLPRVDQRPQRIGERFAGGCPSSLAGSPRTASGLSPRRQRATAWPGTAPPATSVVRLLRLQQLLPARPSGVVELAAAGRVGHEEQRLRQGRLHRPFAVAGRGARRPAEDAEGVGRGRVLQPAAPDLDGLAAGLARRAPNFSSTPSASSAHPPPPRPSSAGRSAGEVRSCRACSSRWPCETELVRPANEDTSFQVADVELAARRSPWPGRRAAWRSTAGWRARSRPPGRRCRRRSNGPRRG